MLRKILSALLFFTLVTSCQSKENNEASNVDYVDVLTEKVSGSMAYETTSFVEKYWRVVGNTGFNASIYYIADHLEKAGFILEEKAKTTDQLTYRIEKRALTHPTWEPVNASVTIEGESSPLLQHETNSNMIALNSFSTPKGGVKARVIRIENINDLSVKDVKGKIVFAELSPGRLFNEAVVKSGAIGVITYSNPEYLQPQKNTTSIQFRSIPYNETVKSWGIAMSYEAKEILKNKLQEGEVTLNVTIDTKIYPSEELTLVAEVKGLKDPNERLVYSAHVQEPGANDNASGVGVAVEMAMVTADLITSGTLDLNRTLTFLWGDEIVSTRRYVEEDSLRAKDIKWGISLDMVGQNTALTGGSFLIEKMPDPSAIWTRGNDKHSEWGGSKMDVSEMKPHYLNDFIINVFKEQGKRANWEVNTNPFEGGSDHVPFLKADIPSVLFWHFTDQFYHTDNDRIDKVSQETLRNVGTAALVTAYTLLNSDETTAKELIQRTEESAIARLDEELKQGKIAISKGETVESQRYIIKVWERWYIDAINSTTDMTNDPKLLETTLQKAISSISTVARKNRDLLSQ